MLQMKERVKLHICNALLTPTGKNMGGYWLSQDPTGKNPSVALEVSAEPLR